MDRLPEELLHTILLSDADLDLFYTFRQVCRRWNHICALWPRVIMADSQIDGSDLLTLLAYVGGHLRVLDLSSCVLDQECWGECARLCLGLNQLRLAQSNIGEEAIVVFLKRNSATLTLLNLSGVRSLHSACFACPLPRLQKLRLMRCGWIDDPGLALIAAGCPCLTGLRLARCRGVTTSGLESILTHCAQLEALDIANCDANDRFVPYLLKTPRLRSADLTRCGVTDQGLVQLAIVCLYRDGESDDIELDMGPLHTRTDGRILAALERRALRRTREQRQGRERERHKEQKTLALQRLDMSACAALTSVGVSALALIPSALASLSLVGCRQVGDSGIETVARRRGGALEELFLRGCDQIGDASMHALGAHCPGLTTLHLSVCHVTTEGMRALAAGCPRLTSLSCSSDALEDNALVALGQNCHGLRSLDLQDCRQLTQRGLAPLSRGCPELRTLDLRGWHSLRHLQPLQRMRALRALNLRQASGVTDATLISVANGCRRLVKLDLSFQMVTNRSLEHLAEGCPCLREMVLKGCHHITDSGLIELARHCPLESVVVRGCSSVTWMLEHHLPHITFTGLPECASLHGAGDPTSPLRVRPLPPPDPPAFYEKCCIQ